MNRAWDLLTGKRAREVTGLQVAGVGGLTFVEGANKAQLADWQMMSGVAQNLAFKQGPWPSSLAADGAELNGSTATLKPSTLYSTEDGSAGYMLQLVAVSAAAASGTSRVNVYLTDGSNNCSIGSMASVGQAPVTFLPTIPIYFNENVYITIVEGASNACDVDYVYQVISYGGNA